MDGRTGGIACIVRRIGEVVRERQAGDGRESS